MNRAQIINCLIQKMNAKSYLEMFVVNTDYGCGVIRKGQQTLLTVQDSELNWHGLSANRTEWLNLISVEEFVNRLNRWPSGN